MKDYRKSASPGVGELRGAESRRSRSAPRKPETWKRLAASGPGGFHRKP